MISYYDLLGMLKTDTHPLKVKLHLCNKSVKYYYSKDDNCYLLEDEKQKSQTFCFYMNECLTDKQFLDNIIEIVN